MKRLKEVRGKWNEHGQSSSDNRQQTTHALSAGCNSALPTDYAVLLRRNIPAPINNPTNALVGSGTGVQVSVDVEPLKEK